MVYLERHEGPEPFSASARLGGRAPVWAGGPGRAVLTRLSEDERTARLDVEGGTDCRRQRRAGVVSEIESAISTGIARRVESDRCAGPATARGADQMGEHLLAVAAELEVLLGARPTSDGSAAADSNGRDFT